ncbi:hypothetical protein FOA43_002353 [Brettanomyces nanus]|uniref:Uncharacterized protein n=1 Tax=Eeniella nana TaxID=13502 RepID=A0A875S268_EENNA|nr:uncharacterized protein FOA43_002353 [Brettanomyces nanus]QPG75013.1 hypothetical protein FOA43_002353 [Brettanomyces nanus]
MSLACRLLNLTNCGNEESVFRKYDLSNEETVYSALVSQHHRDTENGSTDVSKDRDATVNTLSALFLDEHGVSKRIDSGNKMVDALKLTMLLERALADNHNKAEILNLSEITMIKTRVEQLGKIRAEKLKEINDETLSEVDEQIQRYETKLQNHLVGLAKFGYFKDFLISSEDSIRQNIETVGSKAEDRLEKSLEDLVSSVISLSIQHGVALPEPDLERMKDFIGRIEWCRECIDKLVSGIAGEPIKVHNKVMARSNSAATHSPVAASNSSSKIELKRALNDLQFAHVYLTRQYEDERSRYNKSLNQLRLKLSQSQELLSCSNEQLTNQTQQSLKLEMKLNDALNELREKKKILHAKSLEINMLKVDKIGERSTSSTNNGDENSSNACPSKDNSTVSAPILRMQFKNLVQQMNEDFEKELEKERVERKRLEELVKLYEKGSTGRRNTSASASGSLLTPASSSPTV